MAIVVAMARAALIPAPNLTYFERRRANSFNRHCEADRNLKYLHEATQLIPKLRPLSAWAKASLGQRLPTNREKMNCFVRGVGDPVDGAGLALAGWGLRSSIEPFSDAHD